VHPAFALTRTRLGETRREFDTFLQASAKTLALLEKDRDSSAEWVRVVARASGIEGVYTGIENVLKTILGVTDGGVIADAESYHAQLLAQSAEATAKRSEIIGGELYGKLDRLRAFRHRERINYRHVLSEGAVNENLALLKETYPKFEAEITAFIETWEQKPKDDDEPTSSHKI
jgi:hypothetical protein